MEVYFPDCQIGEFHVSESSCGLGVSSLAKPPKCEVALTNRYRQYALMTKQSCIAAVKALSPTASGVSIGVNCHKNKNAKCICWARFGKLERQYDSKYLSCIYPKPPITPPTTPSPITPKPNPTCKITKQRKNVKDLTENEKNALTKALQEAVKSTDPWKNFKDIANFHGAPTDICNGSPCCPHSDGTDFLIWHRYLFFILI